MKTITLWVMAVSAIAMSVSSAFSLDAVGYQGGELPLSPLSIFVPGYGEIVFEETVESFLVVESGYQDTNICNAPSLRFDPAESVKVSFSNQLPINLTFASIGLPIGRTLTESHIPAEPVIDPAQEAGKEASGYIPEATSAILGLIGTLLLLARRNR